MSKDQERKIGIPVDEFVAKSKQESARTAITNATRELNETIQTARAHYGAAVTLSVGDTGVVIDDISFPEPKIVAPKVESEKGDK